MAYRYVPLFRSKSGEAAALFHLNVAAKDRIFPIFNLTKSVSGSFASEVGKAWAGRHLGLSGQFNYKENGSGADFQRVFAELTSAGVNVVPTIAFGAPAEYAEIVWAITRSAGTGLAVKVRTGDLQQVAAWLAANGQQPQDVDLVLTVGHIPDIGEGVVDDAVLHTLQQLRLPLPWRSITLAASAAPKDMSSMKLGHNAVPRLDWLLWQKLHPQVDFQLDYGDCGISHPGMKDAPGFAMAAATVSVRYTTDSEWIVLKGRPIKGTTRVDMPKQYKQHAATLVAAPQFGGVANCWGDGRIPQIASGAISAGNRRSWVELGANRHLSLVADRLP